MKRVLVAFTMVVSFAAAGAAQAQSDDAKWVAQCLQDNAGASVPLEVVTAYCTCMNSKMDANETRSITEWEKANPNERKACEAAAGWK